MKEHPLNYSLIVLDADGSVRECVLHSTPEHPMPCHNQKSQWRVIEGTQGILAQYDWTHTFGGIVSNQAGIALNYTTNEAVEEEFSLLIRAIFPPFAKVALRYSPYAPDSSSYARKPSPWMILDIAREFSCRLDRTLYVGDSIEDKVAASRAGVEFLWAWQFFGRPEVGANMVKAHEVKEREG